MPDARTLTTEPPAGAPAASADGSRRPAPTGLLRITPVVAIIGVALALIGVLILLVPVDTPIQDCGTPAGFLLDGRTDAVADPARPPRGATRADVEANDRRPCREQVVARARMAAVALGVGLLAAIGALLVEVAVRWRIYRRSASRSGLRPPTDAEPSPPDPVLTHPGTPSAPNTDEGAAQPPADSLLPPEPDLR